MHHDLTLFRRMMNLGTYVYQSDRSHLTISTLAPQTIIFCASVPHNQFSPPGSPLINRPAEQTEIREEKKQ